MNKKQKQNKNKTKIDKNLIITDGLNGFKMEIIIIRNKI
jgi:hypothetical protein